MTQGSLPAPGTHVQSLQITTRMRMKPAVIIGLVTLMLVLSDAWTTVEAAPRHEQMGMDEESGIFGKIKSIPKKIGSFLSDRLKSLKEKIG
ncbi:uncharacterized protein LOC135384017 isoform X2 [Ornithodoros turicata]|uniref:uncharacterized protein LOC135384017 isoform X2 n=1 Tax=Ornithodoros turicata TaxID=34597 RepID=UPI0031390724